MKDFAFTRFRYLYWFCVLVFVVSFTAMVALIFVPIPDQNREMAANTQGFLQGSLIMSVIGFMLTGSILGEKKKSQEPGIATMEFTATGKTEVVEDTETNDKEG